MSSTPIVAEPSCLYGRKKQMNSVRMTRRSAFGMIAVLACLTLSGCEYDVPITSKPTRKVDGRLLGDWMSKDRKDKMKVRRLDDDVYIISYNGDLFRGYHSDLAKTSFVSVQDIDSAERKYS